MAALKELTLPDLIKMNGKGKLYSKLARDSMGRPTVISLAGKLRWKGALFKQPVKHNRWKFFDLTNETYQRWCTLTSDEFRPLTKEDLIQMNGRGVVYSAGYFEPHAIFGFIKLIPTENTTFRQKIWFNKEFYEITDNNIQHWRTIQDEMHTE